MSLEARTRYWLLCAVGAAAAVVTGIQLADGNPVPAIALLLLPAIVVVERWIPLGAAGLLLAALLVGNTIGNRGFAQLAPLAPLPLFPAELGLVAGVVWLALRGARMARLPFRTDPLGFAVLAWIVLSSLRLPFDVREHGFLALRDYALVYYAGFFFFAREAAADDRVRRGLHGAWILAVLGLAFVYPLYATCEAFFLGQFTFRGVPVIAIKNDLAGTFAAAGAMYAAVRWTGLRQARWTLALVVALGLALYIVSRAAFVGMVVAVLVYMPGARLKIARALGVLLVIGALVATVQVAGDGRSWKDTRLYDVYEHAVSLADVTGSRAYEGLESGDTGDNTQFRLVWWRLLIERTLAEAPLTGSGFGADISGEFARDYLGAGAGDFTARSPHNVLLTVFARSGLAGLLPFLAFAALFLNDLWRRRVPPGAPDGQASDDAVRDAALGCAALVIFVSACFGVVLEGPMGAVVFWILLGTATARPAGEAAATSLVSTQDKPWQIATERPYR